MYTKTMSDEPIKPELPSDAEIEARFSKIKENLTLELEKNWPDEDRKRLTEFGYQVKTAGSATLSAIAKEGTSLVAGMR